MPAYETKILPVEKDAPGAYVRPTAVKSATIQNAEDDDMFGDNVEAEIAPDNPAHLKRIQERV